MLFDDLTRRIDVVPDSLWTLLYLLWVVGGTTFLLLRRQRPATTLAWLLAFWSLPIVGAVGYFLLGPRRLDDQSELRQGARRVAARAIPKPAETLPERFVEESPFAALARVPRAGGDVEPEPKRAAALELYEDGDEAYPAILAAIGEARETLHIEYYIWQPDVSGTRFRDAAVERARAGVRVRVLVDALGAKSCRDAFWRPLRDAGGEVRSFNPPHLFKPQPGKLNFRTHRKIVVIDAKRAFTGGINVSDNNRGDTDAPPWRSTHLRIDGAPALDLQAIFLEDWLYGLSIDEIERGKRDAVELLPGTDSEPELPDDIERWFPETEEANEGPWVQIVDSGPDEKNDDIHLLFFSAIVAARERLWITTPYFVPDAPIESALESAAARGVDVRLVLPEAGDSKLVDAAAATYSRDVAEKGARISLYEPRMNHSKVMIVDDALAIVGTANMDNRSFRLNFEVVAALHDRDVVARLAAMFERDLEHSRDFAPERESLTLAERLLENSARLLSPLL